MPTLNWLNRNETLTIAKREPYRLLEHDPELSYGDTDTNNMIIQGDNLNALKALLPYYAGKVKCIYIDPPYNTKSAFGHYDDNLEHSIWISMIYPRLELLWELLTEDGSIWISVDDSEAHYLKVIMDEIFGRGSFVASNVWQKRYSRENREAIGDSHEYIFVYTKDREVFKKNRHMLPLGEKQLKLYKNPDNDLNGDWQSVSLTAQGFRPNQMYVIESPSGKKHKPPEGSCWKIIESNYKKELKEGKIYFGKNGTGVPRRKNYLKNAKGLVPWTWWSHDEVGHTDESKKEIHALFGKKDAFDTPKPERLIQRVIHIATNENDIVLDSFLGSGTTAAVAHKMNRQYIGIEMGEHATTLCVPRMKKVIDGEQGGISKAVNWKGGGGYRFYHLGSPIFDEYGKINQDIKFPTLASHIWFSETSTPLPEQPNSPLLGIHEDVAYYLLFNGILGDKRPDGGNVLTSKVLKSIPEHSGTKIIFGEMSRFGSESLKKKNIIFKQIPYDIKAR